MGQQARGSWGMDSAGYQFWNGCIVAAMEVEIVTTPC